MKIPLIVICGATASGKTGLSIELAKRLDGEIISADSMQIYRYMDIGTAKPDARERQGIVHHMIDIVDPWEPFSVADFTRMAHAVAGDIYKRGKLPIVAGGTGLYINSLVDDVDFGVTDTDLDYREELKEFARDQGAQALWERLLDCDPNAARRIHCNNIKRVIRALEFYHTTGKQISRQQADSKLGGSRYQPVMMEISWERPELYERINRRVDIMMETGLENEVKDLIRRGCTRDMQSMKGIGYQEMLAFFDGEDTFQEAVEKIKRNSRRYAKRQTTWFKRDERIARLKPGEQLADSAMEVIHAIIG